jgi:hypothetical protein
MHQNDAVRIEVVEAVEDLPQRLLIGMEAVYKAHIYAMDFQKRPVILEKLIARFPEDFFVLDIQRAEQPILREAFPAEVRIGIDTPLPRRPQGNEAASGADANLEVVAPTRRIQCRLGDFDPIH